MANGPDGRVRALQEFATDVAKTSTTIQGPATKQHAVQYRPPAMPVDTLQQAADQFKDALYSGAGRAETWDGEFHSSLNLYTDFANVLSNRVTDVDQTHGQALTDLLNQMSGAIPRRGV